MKRGLYFLLLCVLFCSPACKKASCTLPESTVVASSSEIATIQNFLTTHGLTALQHSSGFFYSISDGGNGDTPTLCSNVGVTYKGTLLNGSIFDQSTSMVSFPLANLIVGWQKGIPLVRTGGKITLYVPPSMGYGNTAISGIPANSTLIFEITLVSVTY